MKFILSLVGRIVYWFIWPGTWLYLRWSNRTRVIIYCNGEILAVQGFLSNGKLHLPGGGLKGDETPAHGAVRELYEETGLALHEAEVIHLSTEPYEHHGFQFTCHYYVFFASFKPVVKPKFPEVIGVYWLDRSDIDRYTCNPDLLRGLELVKQELQHRRSEAGQGQAQPARHE